jgi:hypothetical protein
MIQLRRPCGELPGIWECCGSGVREISEYIFVFAPEHPTNPIARKTARAIVNFFMVISIAGSGLRPKQTRTQRLHPVNFPQ